ncbi:hypothetical protein [Actinomadura sp. WMMA1423]|uniref:hypothetical protein n=1 Tax=Actinomadura sp. WMMA1423 TaxID=2591108 RepID=UPI00114767C0|nr:hypothetical protein [Actinomadura sp. WMMA1423]
MPTNEHELPLEMVRNRPQLVPELLRSVFGLDVSGHARATLASESYADANPAELRCDATVLLGDPHSPLLGVVVESQLRPLKQKSYSWPAYLASLRLRRRCPVILLVLCPDQNTARGCAVPIEMGHPGWILEPLTVHPGMLPPITDPNQAHRLPELAVLSAPAHVEGPDAEAVLHGLAAALGSLSGDIGPLYHDYVMSRFSDAARKLMEDTVKLDNYEWQSEFAMTHRAEGRAEGEVKALLLLLEARGLDVPEDVRARVEGCTDPEQIERWIQRAVSADTAEDLFT